jgi:hypothetical protein
MRFWLFGLSALFLALCFAMPGATPASAEVNGRCVVTVNGQDIGPLSSSSTGDAIKVHKDDTLTIVMTSSAGFASHSIDLELAGFSINLQDKPDDGDQSWIGSTNVHDYARFGVGLYKVVGEGHLEDGSVCTGGVLIEVQGSGLTSLAGLIATAVLIFGLLVLGGTLAGSVQRYGGVRRRVEAWAAEQMKRISAGGAVSEADLASALREIAHPRLPITLWMIATMPLFILLGAIPESGSFTAGIGGGGASRLLRLPRMGFRPGTSIAGSVGGAVATEAVVVLFQQFAISPLTQSNTIVGLGAGLLLAVVFTTGVRVWGGRHVNKAIADAETRLNAAIEQIRREAGLPPSPPQLATEMGASGTPPAAEPPTPPEDGGVREP